MPLSAFRRPLVIVLLLYIAALSAYNERGGFRVRGTPGWDYFLYRSTLVVQGRVLSGFSEKRAGDRYWVHLEKIEGNALTPVDAMVYVSRVSAEPIVLRPGQRVLLYGKLRRPLWPRLPGGFDEEAFLDQHGAAYVFHAEKAEVVSADVSWWYVPWVWGDRVHRSLHRYFKRRFPPVEAAILEGLLVGYRGPLPTRISRAIQDAGVMHLLTPSGAKVTLVLAVALWLSSLCAWPPWARLSCAAIAATAYLFVVGPEPPYTRAYGMGLCAYAAYALGRGVEGFQGWVLSALAVLALEPRALLSAGFQLTYLAMLGILVALPRWRLSARWPMWVRSIWAVGVIGVIVQLMLWPAFTRFFGKGSIAGFGVNPLLVPGSIIPMGTAAGAWAADALGWVRVEQGLSQVAEASAQFFSLMCVEVASWRYASVECAPWSVWACLVYYFFVGGLFLLPDVSLCKRAWGMGACLAAGLWVHAAWAGAVEEVVVLGARGGRGMIVRQPGKAALLIDDGMSPSSVLTVSRRMGVSPQQWARVPAKDLSGMGFIFSYGRTRIIWRKEFVQAEIDGRVDSCVMTRGARRPQHCPYRNTFYTRWEGAIWIRSDGESLHLRSQREHGFG